MSTGSVSTPPTVKLSVNVQNAIVFTNTTST